MSNRRSRIRQGERRFLAFHEKDSQRIDTVNFPDHDTLVIVGAMTYIGYQAHVDGKDYMHEFRRKSQPILAVSHDGRQLYIVNGRYRFTSRGIVDT